MILQIFVQIAGRICEVNRMIKLKPCPFCGGEAEMGIKYGDYGYNPDIYSVKCKRCNARIGKVSDNYADLSDDVGKAWNRRVNDD